MSIAKGIHLKLRRPLDVEPERTRFAMYCAQTIDRGPQGSLPHLLNERSSYGFRLDTNNDYFLLIDEEDSSIITINMRYPNAVVLTALLTWIGHRWDQSKVVTPEIAQ